MLTANTPEKIDFGSRVVNFILSIKPLATFAKEKARQMMIDRAERIGVSWRDNVRQLQNHDWETEKKSLENPNLQYPDYYLTSFHAYESGNMSWLAAWEVESAAYAVHATIWDKIANVQGDQKLRSSYHQVLQDKLPIYPQTILDLGCSVGMSTFALQDMYPQATVTGLDLSPYFLSVAQVRSKTASRSISWIHSMAESTPLPSASFDLVSACLMFHELPQSASKAIFQEAKRLLKPGGYLTIMDMNPQSETFKKMPPYVLTLLKSTEPYLDEYFTLNISEALQSAGFAEPLIIQNSPRHRTIIAKIQEIS